MLQNNGVYFDKNGNSTILSSESYHVTTVLENEDLNVILSFISHVFHSKELLIVLDNIEDILDEDHELFSQTLNQILIKCPILKVLCTSRKYINKLENIQEKPYHLSSLSSQNSIKLLLGL